MNQKSKQSATQITSNDFGRVLELGALRFGRTVNMQHENLSAKFTVFSSESGTKRSFSFHPQAHTQFADQFANRITKLILRKALSPLADLIKRTVCFLQVRRPSEYGRITSCTNAERERRLPELTGVTPSQMATNRSRLQ